MQTADGMTPASIGLDDGHAYTKVALTDGRLVAIPSRARVGRANVTWLDTAERRIGEYETEATLYAVGEVEGEPTHFEGYPFSGLQSRHRPARLAAGGARRSLGARRIGAPGERLLPEGRQPAE